MRENLTFGISLDAQNFLSSLKKVYDSIRSLRVSIHDMANDFSNIFSDKRIQDAAKLKGEYLGLYGNLQSIGKNISDVFSDIGKATGVVVRETFVKLFKITSSLTKVGLEFTNAFLKLPFTILKLIDSFADLKGLISDAYKTFEDLVNQSIKLQQFFQGSKQFGDSLVKTAQTITKNIVGVNVEQVTGFLKQASAETKGFFNPKDVDATMIKSINSLAAALGTSFEDAAQKFTRFITGDSEMVRQLADELGRVGISLADIAAASQHAQAGLAGANQRAANLTALLSAKLKDANQIALQSVSGVQEVLGKNLAAIGTALIDPLYGKIRKVFMELLSLVQRNEKTIRYLLQTLASAIAPVFDLIIAGIHELEKLFQGLAKNFLSSSKEMSISLDLLGRPVQLLVDVFRSMYDAVIKVGSVLIQPSFLQFYKDLYDRISLIAATFVTTFQEGLSIVVDLFASLGQNTKFMDGLFNVFKKIGDLIAYVGTLVGGVLIDALSDATNLFKTLANSLANAGIFDVITKGINTVSNLLTKFVSLVKTNLSFIFSFLSELASNESLIGGIKKFIDSFISGIGRIVSIIMDLSSIINFNPTLVQLECTVG